VMMRKDLVQLLCTTRAVAGGAKFDSYLGTIKRKVMKHFDLVSFVSCHVRVPFTLSALGNFGTCRHRPEVTICIVRVNLPLVRTIWR